MKTEHIPVLLNETINALNIKSDGIYVDLTLGRAGHSSEILTRCKNGLLIAFDQDIEAIKKSEEVLNKIGTNYRLIHSNFINVKDKLLELNIDKVDGIMMDLGVSSPQFDQVSRGFSYKNDAPLDMRMDQRKKLTAKEVVNTYSFEELCRVFREYGDERFADKIADNIIKYRSTKPIETTLELVEIIKKSKPDKVLSQIGHPAKQVFQALRIEVNDELNVLTKAIYQCLDLLKSGGRLVIITFHSGEDKIVKNIFKSKTTILGNRYDLPMDDEKLEFALFNKKPICPSEQEINNNHRSVSAKLRVIEKI